VAATELAGRRVLITGAARGIGAEIARRLHRRGARVALAGLEPELLSRVAVQCGDAPWYECDVTDRDRMDAATAACVTALGGLDVVIANAGVAAQLPLLGGDPEIFEGILRINVLGTYHTVRSAAPHIAHPGGYALLIASLAAAVHPPLLGAYSAAKAAVAALGDTLRIELHATGARVGVGYFGKIATDMTARGFGTAAASRLPEPPFARPVPVSRAAAAIERGVAHRARRVVAPAWVGGVLAARGLTQRVVDLGSRRGLPETLALARSEVAPLTTPQPE
jgi:NAD(P)-dependent dehydrogenase (short-subunit alcohol dehydrogenase family)